MNADTRQVEFAPCRLAFVWAFCLLLFPTSVSAWNLLPPGSDALSARLGAVRGVTIGPIESSQQPGRGYGSKATAETLDEMVRLGANWVSITPFGRIWDLKSTTIDPVFEAPHRDNIEGVRRLVEMAHARGLRVLLIPHLWVETGGWRAHIDPGSEEGWQAYIRSYTAFLLNWAKVSESAYVDAMSIGVECMSWSSQRGAEWTRLIDEVRASFSGLLTYSANWDEAEHVIFWDQLDFIGINAFYPLAHQNDADLEGYVKRTIGIKNFYPLGHNLKPAAAVYRLNAMEIAAWLESWTQTLDMPLVFVEIGYTTREYAAIEPWEWPDHMVDVKVDEAEQARGLQALFDAFLPQPWFSGFFLWRYYNYLHDVSQEAIWGFSPRGKLAEQALQEAFSHPWAADGYSFFNESALMQ